jgi:hypothetical protein
MRPLLMPGPFRRRPPATRSRLAWSFAPRSFGSASVLRFGCRRGFAGRAHDRRIARPCGDDPGLRLGARQGYQCRALSSLRPERVQGRSWEEDQRSKGQNPTAKAWRRYCDEICEGTIWNLNLLNAQSDGGVEVGHRIVDFQEVFTLPRLVLESLLKSRDVSRPQLLPPDREHLSQAFARFFMRVGLPTPVTKTW